MTSHPADRGMPLGCESLGTVLGFLWTHPLSQQTEGPGTAAHCVEGAGGPLWQSRAACAHTPPPPSSPAWVLACISLKHVRNVESSLGGNRSHLVDFFLSDPGRALKLSY